MIAEIISLGDKKLNKKLCDAITRYMTRIKELLTEGVEKGIFKLDMDTSAAANLFFGMTQGLVNTWALGNYSFNLEERYEPMWKIFREAIIKR